MSGSDAESLQGAGGAPAREADPDARWRELVFPAGWRNPQPAPRYNLVVIGAGPAGLVTSIAAAGLGARVALVERHAMGGDCLNVGCVPSKTLLAAAAGGLGFDAAMQRLREVRAGIAVHDSVERYTRAGVDVFLGAARFEDAHTVVVDGQRLRTRRTVIATGARAAMPPVPGLAELPALTNETVFALRAQPRRLAVLGGGPIGCELAQAFARLGSAVDLVEMQPRLLSADDAEPASLVQEALVRDGVRLHLGRKVVAAARESGGSVLALDDGMRIEADAVLVAAGRRRNVEGLDLDRAGVRLDARGGLQVDARLRTTHPDVFAAGDVCSPLQFTQVADAQARIVVRNALFMGRARTDALVVPWCTYTDPELAQVGATRRELEAAGRPFDAFRFAFADLDRGRTDGDAAGWAEVRVARGSDRLLGATVVGRDAGEQLAPLVVLMTLRQGLGALGSLVLPYPTRSEYLRRLVDAWNRTRLTPRTAGLLSWWLRRSRGGSR
ncbi:MAG: FAD-dependent oxidoreductase [Steroidobacteraceae bacterium]|nr:FAD-dependent oxidoreductase [Steroidobacteraceae bacterium]